MKISVALDSCSVVNVSGFAEVCTCCDVALCLLIALEIIEKNKEKALFFSHRHEHFSQLERNLYLLAPSASMCAHCAISDWSLLPPARSFITLLGWCFFALFNELVRRELAKELAGRVGHLHRLVGQTLLGKRLIKPLLFTSLLTPRRLLLLTQGDNV